MEVPSFGFRVWAGAVGRTVVSLSFLSLPGCPEHFKVTVGVGPAEPRDTEDKQRASVCVSLRRTRTLPRSCPCWLTGSDPGSPQVLAPERILFSGQRALPLFRTTLILNKQSSTCLRAADCGMWWCALASQSPPHPVDVFSLWNMHLPSSVPSFPAACQGELYFGPVVLCEPGLILAGSQMLLLLL